MLEYYITNTNNYNETQLDYEIINQAKTFYSIYNNKISQPFHNFWFILSNLKFKCSYNDNNILRFGLNNKESNIQKFLIFFKNLSDHLVKIFSSTYSNITIEFPWKAYDNYPFIITIFTSKNTIFINNDKDVIDFNQLSNIKTYSILFEIKNIKIIKINLDDKISHIIKFNLNMIMIQQEPELDLKKYLLNSIKYSDFNTNLNNLSTELRLDNTKPKLPFLDQLSNSTLKSNLNQFTNSFDKSNTSKINFNLNELLNIKSKLKRVVMDNTCNNTIQDDNLSELASTFINQKNQLKKTITKEKTLFNSLKDTKKKKKKKKDKHNLINIDNNNSNLNDELDEKIINTSYDKSDKNNKKNIDSDLEKQLELFE